MERQDKKKTRRRNHDPTPDTASPSSRKGSEASEDDSFTGSSSKIENEMSENVSRDSPASGMDPNENFEQGEYKRKSDSTPLPNSQSFKKPKIDDSQNDNPAPLVRKLSLKDFLQKRNQNKTPSPSSTGFFSPQD